MFMITLMIDWVTIRAESASQKAKFCWNLIMWASWNWEFQYDRRNELIEFQMWRVLRFRTVDRKVTRSTKKNDEHDFIYIIIHQISARSWSNIRIFRIYKVAVMSIILTLSNWKKFSKSSSLMNQFIRCVTFEVRSLFLTCILMSAKTIFLSFFIQSNHHWFIEWFRRSFWIREVSFVKDILNIWSVIEIHQWVDNNTMKVQWVESILRFLAHTFNIDRLTTLILWHEILISSVLNE